MPRFVLILLLLAGIFLSHSLFIFPCFIVLITTNRAAEANDPPDGEEEEEDNSNDDGNGNAGGGANQCTGNCYSILTANAQGYYCSCKTFTVIKTCLTFSS